VEVDAEDEEEEEEPVLTEPGLPNATAVATLVPSVAAVAASLAAAS